MKKLFDNKIFKTIYLIFKVVFIVLIVAYLSFIIIQRFSGNKSLLGHHVFTIATGSMEGVYNINDVILVEDCNPNNLKVGDDIAYNGERGGLEGMVITHRIVKIEDGDSEKIFFTKGVRSKVVDPSITSRQIVGKVVGVVPVVTQINHIVKSQLGFFLTVFCPLVVVIALEILQTITDIQIANNEIKKIDGDNDTSNDIETSSDSEIEIL